MSKQTKESIQKGKITKLNNKTKEELVTIILRKDEVEKKKDQTISNYKDLENSFRSLIDKKNAIISSHNKELELYIKKIDEAGFAYFKLKLVAIAFAIGLIAALVVPLL